MSTFRNSSVFYCKGSYIDIKVVLTHFKSVGFSSKSDKLLKIGTCMFSCVSICIARYKVIKRI